MVTEVPIPHDPEILDKETVRTTAGDLIHNFNLALRKLPALKGKFEILDEPLEKKDPFVLIDQMVNKPYADYGVFDYNGTSYTFEGLGDSERLFLFGCPQITEPVDILNIPSTLRAGEYPFLSLRTTFPHISWSNMVVKGGVQISMEEFENNTIAVERAQALLQSFQTQLLNFNLRKT